MYCCVPRLNITVISPPGIVEADQDMDFVCEYCNDQNLCYVNWLNSDEFIRDIDHRMDLTKWVKFVNGNVKSINRLVVTIYLEITMYLYICCCVRYTPTNSFNVILRRKKNDNLFVHI